MYTSKQPDASKHAQKMFQRGSLPVKSVIAKLKAFPLEAKIYQLIIMLSTSNNVLFPGHNHLLTTGANDLTLLFLPEHQRGHMEVDSMVVSWWIVSFLRCFLP